MKKITIGSLFDGSGGFPLAGEILGMTPVWGAEVAPTPIKITNYHFPNMLQLGSVTEIDGGKIPFVDVITFGSPCQDLSIAGKHEGLNGAKSGLFFEAVRIIRQMRQASKGVYPRFVVWENVLNALSSNKGEDFRKVLEEFVSIEERLSNVPKPEKWERYGQIVGEKTLTCWGVLSPEFFQLGQTRQRVFVVADFRPSTSRESVFDSSAMFSDFEKSQKIWETYISRFKRTVRKENRDLKIFWARSHSGDYSRQLQTFPTITAKDLPCVIVCNDGRLRRLSNSELARLQGFPENYINNVVYDANNVDIGFWRKVFETDCRVRGLRKSKTDEQIIKWVIGGISKTEISKMWGNGVALPCVIHVLRKIKEQMK